MNLVVGLDALGESSSLDSLFGLVNFLLSNVCVSVVSPHGVGSEFASLSVAPMFMRNVSNGSSLVVIRNFHSFSVFLVGQGFNLLFEKIVLFHLVKSPGRTNSQNVGAFIRAFLLVVVVSNETGFVGFDRSGAVSREGLNLEFRDGRDHLSVDGAFVSGIFKGIVVAGVKVVFSRDSGWVRLNGGRSTSRANHLSPNLWPTATLSVVGICWRAKGLMGAIALLKAAG